jgi:hypothetical protein
MALTVKDVAQREQVSERQIQRYVREGFKGHVLPAVRVGKSFQIEETAYKQWRIACGWDQPEAPEDVGRTSTSIVSQDEVIAAPQYPPWPHCADQNGELTTGPSEHSRNWPHPLAVEAYNAELRRKQQQPLRGYYDENEN